MKNLIHDQASPFMKRLTAIAIDECHLVKAWGPFRPYYTKLPNLRDCLPSVPFLALTATLQQHQRGEFQSSVAFRNMSVIETKVKNEIQSLWRIPLNDPNGFDDLKILLPREIKEPRDIPQTYVFVQACLLGTEAAQFLRRFLPEQFHPIAHKLIRVFHSPLDDASKKQTIDGIYDESARIIFTTDALGLGMNKAGIARIVQFKVDSKLDIETICQRFGRGGRGSQDPYLCILFATKQQLASHTGDSIFDTAISRENRELIETKLIPLLQAPANTKPQAVGRTTTSSLPPAIQLLLHTKGCLNNATSLPFEMFENVFGENDGRGCHCENCLLASTTLTTRRQLHKVSISNTKAWLDKYPQTARPQKVTRKRAIKITLTEDRLEKIMEAVSDWVDQQKADCRYSQFASRKLLPKETRSALRQKLNQIHSIDDLQDVLKACGHSPEEGFMKGRVGGLYSTIENAIKSSRPPSLLEQCLANAGYHERNLNGPLTSTGGPTRQSCVSATTQESSDIIHHRAPSESSTGTDAVLGPPGNGQAHATSVRFNPDTTTFAPAPDIAAPSTSSSNPTTSSQALPTPRQVPHWPIFAPPIATRKPLADTTASSVNASNMAVSNIAARAATSANGTSLPGRDPPPAPRGKALNSKLPSGSQSKRKAEAQSASASGGPSRKGKRTRRI